MDSGVDPLRFNKLRFFKFSANALLAFKITDGRLNSKQISLQWLQVYWLKQVINLLTGASPLALAKSLH